jgi:hypothetical protein
MCAPVFCIVMLCLIHRIWWTMIETSSLLWRLYWHEGTVSDVIINEIYVVEVVCKYAGVLWLGFFVALRAME